MRVPINNSGFCPKCHSTAVRKPWIFGKRYCINNECYYHYTPILKNRWEQKIKDLVDNQSLKIEI